MIEEGSDCDLSNVLELSYCSAFSIVEVVIYILGVPLPANLEHSSLSWSQFICAISTSLFPLKYD